MKFEGTSSYVATDDLTVAVNAAVALQRPLLVKGEPGTGKTELARQVAGQFVGGGLGSVPAHRVAGVHIDIGHGSGLQVSKCPSVRCWAVPYQTPRGGGAG